MQVFSGTMDFFSYNDRQYVHLKPNIVGEEIQDHKEGALQLVAELVLTSWTLGIIFKLDCLSKISETTFCRYENAVFLEGICYLYFSFCFQGREVLCRRLSRAFPMPQIAFVVQSNSVSHDL